MIEALRVRDFRLLWVARFVSLLGTWLLVVGVPAQVFELTGSVAATGFTVAVQFLPPVVLGPFAGVLADRWDRRRLMIGADLLRGVAVVLLLLAQEPGDVWLVYVALLVESVGTVVFRPAAQAHTPAVVGTGTALSSANSLNAVSDGIVRLVGAPAGGVLFAWAGFELLVWLDAGTYVVSAVAVLMTARLVAPATRRARGGIREGLRFLLAEPTARALLLVTTVFLGANAVLSALLVPYGMTVLGGSAATGLVMSALGVGFLLGAPLIRVLVERVAPGWLLGGALGVTGCGFVLFFSGGATGLVVVVVAAVLIGVAGSTALGVTQTTLQRVTPDEVLGRTSAAMFTGEAAATFAGALAGPGLAAALSVSTAAYIAGGATAAAGVLAVVLIPRRPEAAHVDEPGHAANRGRSAMPGEPANPGPRANPGGPPIPGGPQFPAASRNLADSESPVRPRCPREPPIPGVAANPGGTVELG
ncbi:hypothetical protein GCM10010435_31510 [Winogradskya consettensis]|uniref:MFS transporter n=1 Tax=Winogradskya consettensis TaxID=113560 RepID=A0A919SEJ4_9ACTN|nr:MFS transporter [Actinoplanes consettensis]GIM70386.1 MFS transporter [Actinoplanes consettensis]